MSKFEIRRVTSQEVHGLRHEILRPHRPFSEIQYDTDLEVTTFHVGAYMDGRLVSVASFNQETHKPLRMTKQFRLRAMATHPDFRRMGLGRQVVDYGVSLLRDEGVQVLWCKGRTSVQAYYEEIGFESFGEVFDYPNLGPHIILYRKL